MNLTFHSREPLFTADAVTGMPPEEAFLNLEYGIIYAFGDEEHVPVFNLAYMSFSDMPYDLRPIKVKGMNNIIFATRRFNLGNLNNYATIRVICDNKFVSGLWARTSIHPDHPSIHFGGPNVHRAFRIIKECIDDVADMGTGDKVFDLTQYIDLEDKDAPVVANDYEIADGDYEGYGGLLAKEVEAFKNLEEEDGGFVLSECREFPQNLPSKPVSRELAPPSTSYEIIDRSEANELALLDKRKQQALHQLRMAVLNYISTCHDDPAEVIAEVITGKFIPSKKDAGPLVINGDLRIVLPAYDETEVEMPAMCRTVYLLFLKHRLMGEPGICQKNIADYRNELFEIYSLIKPGSKEENVRRAIDTLCDTTSNALNVNISRIKHCFENVILDHDVAKRYCITGRRGEPYSIALPIDQISMPRAIAE